MLHLIRNFIMKNKYSIIILLHFVFIAFIIWNRNLLIKDIFELYVLVFLPGFIFANITYLFKKKISYLNYIKKEFFKSLIVQIVIFALVIYSTTTRFITKNDAIKDLNLLVEKLENIHPNLYCNIPKDFFLLILNDYKNNLPNKISELEFYKVCSRLTSFFKDGHTKPMLDFLNKRMQFTLRAIFPYKIKIVDDKIYVIDNLVLFGRIPVGSEIVKINGKSSAQFINEMSQLISYENKTWRNKLISDPFIIGAWNNFNSYKIEYKRTELNKVTQVRSSGGILSKIYIFFLFEKERTEELMFRILPGKIGYIGFYGCNDLKGYKKFYESAFKEIKEKKIKSLIIDIRNNGGGHSIIGTELMQYLFHKPFKEADSATFKISKEIAKTGKLDYYLRPNDRIIGKMHTVVFDPVLPRENSLRFSGKTFLLIDNGTFSAASMFASSFKCSGEGTIIGEETGGITIGFGDVHFFNLPRSKMKIMVSWKKFYYACGVDNRRGVLPDYVVSNTIEDEIQNKDKVLEYTIAMIKKE